MERIIEWIADHPLYVSVGLVILAAAGIYHEGRRFDEFAVTHHCKVVGKMTGSTSTGVGFDSNGNTIVTTSTNPGKTGWLCDDGITYWR